MDGFLQVRRRDVVILVVLVGSALLFFGWAQSDIITKRAVLSEKAASHEAEFFDGLTKSDFEYLVEVDSGKSNGFFGADWGVVRMYTRKKGDAPMDTFTGVEYFYEHDGDAWQLADTARIDLPEYIYEGYRKFEEQGYDVDDQAYLRYNR